MWARLIDLAIWYRADGFLFIIASSSFQTHQSVCIFEGEREGLQISPSLDAGCVQCATMYDLLRDYSDAGNTVLLLDNTPTCRGSWLAGSRAWQWRVHIEIFSSFRQPCCPAKAVEHCKIPWESPMKSQQFFSLSNLCPWPRHPDAPLSHMLSCLKQNLAKWIVKNIHILQQMCKNISTFATQTTL